MQKIRAIAYYLPQYHPIPENDEWWGKGFTEWTNVAKAKPLFKGHEQPKLPADLGFYDLRVPEVREQQAQLAREAGIEGFCYWHYWFGNGKRLLERPFNEVLESGKPDFPFMLAWANETWSGIWHGEKDRILIEQEYSIEDYIEHFNYLLPAFKDKRYIKVDDKPLFLVYRPLNMPDTKMFSKVFNELAVKNGLKGIYLIASNIYDKTWNANENGFDAVTDPGMANVVSLNKLFRQRVKRYIYKRNKKVYRIFFDEPLNVFTFKFAKKFFNRNLNKSNIFILSILTGWDNSPRSKENSLILTKFTPDTFRIHVRETLNKITDNTNLVFIKSWNEWAEGNYIEPDLQYGSKLLNVLDDELKKY